MTDHSTDLDLDAIEARAVQLAESRYRNGYGPTLAEPWEQLHPDVRQDHVTEAAAWLRSAIAAGLLPPTESPTAIADADNPTPLRWGLDDVMWGDDDSVIVLMSGPDREPYWLELDAERAAVLRQNLAGPDGEQSAADENTTPLDLDAERVERYTVAIHDAMESDLSLVDQEPAYQALLARAAEAAVALADAEVDRLRADAAAELLPAWEAMYEPGNVSDYLIGYANSPAAAKGAAVAWLKSQKDEVGRLEWLPQNPIDGYDTEFELVERHDDGIDTGPGIVVRHRTAAARPSA